MAREKDYAKLLEDWPYEYIRMKSPVERKRLLDAAIAAGVDPIGNEIRLMLWKRRYPDGIEADEYLKAWMYFDFIVDELKSFFGKKKRLNETKRYLDIMGIHAVKEYGELGERILFEEMYHLVYNYIQLCANDRNYGSLILGLGKMSKESYALKVANNLCRVCHKVANGLELQEEFAVLQKAAMEAYYDSFPDYEELYDRVIKEFVQ